MNPLRPICSLSPGTLACAFLSATLTVPLAHPSFASTPPDSEFYKYTTNNPDTPENQLNADDFRTPTGLAKPQTWWHWINGNVSREGIEKDLREMSDKGIGFARIFSIDGKLEGPLAFNTPEWYDTFRFTTETAAKYGLGTGIHNCEGWSEAGGPWITPDLSMKELTLKTVRVNSRPGCAEQTITLPPLDRKLDYVRDIAVLAWPAKRSALLAMHKPGVLRRAYAATDDTWVLGDKRELMPASAPLVIGKPVVEGNRLSLLFDGITGDKRVIFSHNNKRRDQFCGVTLEFAQPFEAAGLFTEVSWAYEMPRNIVLEASDDGVHFEKVIVLTFAQPDVTVTFPPRKAKYWRLVRYLSENPSQLVLSNFIQEHVMYLSELELLAPGEFSRASMPIADFNAKAGVMESIGAIGKTKAAYPEKYILHASEILNLTSQFTPDHAKPDGQGTLRWRVPEGEWVVMRIGYTTTSKTNHPARPSGRGLEVDKFDPAALTHHFNSYDKKMIAAAGPLAGSVFSIIETDSWEAGIQNWTANFANDFRARNGYDVIPWLPVYAGECIESVDTTEKFLADLRLTFSSLVMDNFYGQFGRLIRANGLKYESEPSGEMYMRNAMNSFRETDYPMIEVWQDPREPGIVSGVRKFMGSEVQSTAHFYGKKYITCEALTSTKGNWAESPWIMKGTLDTLLHAGTNIAVFHSYTHQPDERAPGWQMEPWGVSQNRKMPWWNFSKDWFTYIARTQYMLQQGKYAARMLFLYSDEVPSAGAGITFKGNHQYNIIEGDGVRRFLKVENGDLVSPGRMRYRFMIISGATSLQLETLERIKELLEDGATICAQQKPKINPSLRGGPEADARWRNLVDELFGDGSKSIRRIGKGTLYVKHTPDDMIAAFKLQESFTCTLADNADPDEIGWNHREHADGSEWFWVINCDSGAPRSGVMSFAVSGKTAAIWRPETGKIEPVPVLSENDGRTQIPLTLEKLEGVFVVFARPTTNAPENTATSVSIDGKPVFPAPADSEAPDNTKISKDFTVFVTVTPTANRKLTEAKTTGILAIDGENIVLNPEPMHLKTGNNDSACTGLSIGKNSIAVIEHSAGFLNSVLVWDHPVPANAHIALVYKNNIPALYLNGEKLATGTPSGRSVHPPANIRRSFKGTASNFSLSDKPLDAAAIAARPITDESKSKNKPAAKAPRLFATADGKLGAEFFANGNVSYKKSGGATLTLSANTIPASKTIDGPYTVTFDAKWGAPSAPQQFDKLVSWTESKIPGIKHYSGTAIYTKTFAFAANEPESNRRIYLEIDQVCEVAEVTINGKRAGTLWRPPYRIDITDFIKPGENFLQIAVANTWVNRCLYDATLTETQRLTWANTIQTHYPAPEKIQPRDLLPWKSGPLPAGLIGKIKLTFSQITVEN